MEDLFLKLLNMSITASYLVLVIIVLRFLLKKAPKSLRCIMWALVGIRLICPITIQSVLSLIPSAEAIPQDITISETPSINSGIVFINNAVNAAISETAAPRIESSINPIQLITSVASIIWFIGVFVMLVYMLISYLLVYKKVRTAVKVKENIWECDYVTTPFIFGIFRPRIYLPSSINSEDIPYVISHEKAHLRRRDYIWKPLGFLLLAVYWFNPLLWIAYILLCRDIEFSCDERVIKELGTEVKKSYSNALINCSVPRKMIVACPLAFGEISVKGRVKNVLNYKKPEFWIIVVGVIACVVVTVCLLTDPIDSKEENKNDISTYDTEAKGKNETATFDVEEAKRKEEELYKIVIAMEKSHKDSSAIHNDYIIKTQEGMCFYMDSTEPISPTFILYDSDNTFHFYWSALSSYVAFGEYTFSDGVLTCNTDDGENTYVFEYDEISGSFTFDASKSSSIPKYRLNGSSGELASPVPDGAVFSLK